MLVAIRASGVSHRGEFTRSRDHPEGPVPVVFDHERAGIGVDMDRKIKIDELIMHVMPRAKISDAFDLMYQGESIPPVVTF